MLSPVYVAPPTPPSEGRVPSPLLCMGSWQLRCGPHAEGRVAVMLRQVETTVEVEQTVHNMGVGPLVNNGASWRGTRPQRCGWGNINMFVLLLRHDYYLGAIAKFSESE